MGSIYKDQFASNIPEDIAVKRCPLTEDANRLTPDLADRRVPGRKSDMFSLYDVDDHAGAIEMATQRNCSFTDEPDGRQSKSKTTPSGRMVEPDGIEPTTSCLQSTRSPN